MNNVTLGERLRYRFDNLMARGPIALIGLLAVLSAAVIVVISVLVHLTGAAPEYSFTDLMWLSLLRTLDSGTMGGDTGTWPFLLAMLGVTFGGIFVISTLIGVLTSGIEGKLAELRKGRSRVIEFSHVVLLGWSPQVFSIISELAVANANQRDACIVVMGEKDKVEMEDEIQEKADLGNGRTRIVCRTGSPIELADLAIVGLDTARAIVILSPESDDPDADVIKTMLAITNNPGRRPGPYHVVAEIRDPRNLDVARMVGGDEVELVLVGNLLARIIAQTCRQSGLSMVYSELLDFGGDEIYFKAEPGLSGKTFGDALLAYEDSAVLGLAPKDGAPTINPPMDTVIRHGDRIIAVSEDDDTLRLSGRADPGIRADCIRPASPRTTMAERTLVLGWNWRASSIINELDAYVPAGSELTVVADDNGAEEVLVRECAGLRNQSATFMRGDTTSREVLESLNVETYRHVIVLAYSDTLDEQRADSRTLVTLLHLRDMANRQGKDFSIVTEMLDLRNRALAEVTRADDFIVSDRLISLLLAQVAENKQLNGVFADIFDPEGSEIYLKPAGDYVALGESINYYTIVEAARRRGEVAFGYRLKAHSGDASKSYGVVVNPDKSVELVFTADDRIVVLAEG